MGQGGQKIYPLMLAATGAVRNVRFHALSWKKGRLLPVLTHKKHTRLDKNLIVTQPGSYTYVHARNVGGSMLGRARLPLKNDIQITSRKLRARLGVLATTMGIVVAVATKIFQ